MERASKLEKGVRTSRNKITELENTQIEFAKVRQEIQDSGERVWNSEGNFANPKAHRLAEKIRDLKVEIRNDPNRAYTRHEFQDISPEQVQPHKGAHEFRGGSGYLLRPGQEKIMSDEDFAKALETGILDKATVEKYGGSMMDDYVMPDGNRYTQQYIPIEGNKGAQFLKERYPSEGLINMMEGSKVKLERPLYIYRNTGYRAVEDSNLKIDPLDVKDDQVYSGMVINPNEVGSKEYISNLIQDGRMGGLHQDPKIIRIEPGTEIYHPGGVADLHEVVVPGNAIKEGQKWDAKDFLKLEPSDIKEGTDLFSSLGLISNIA